MSIAQPFLNPAVSTASMNSYLLSRLGSGMPNELRQQSANNITKNISKRNSAQNILETSGLKPQVNVTNTAAVTIEDYNPLPGKRMDLYMSIQIRNLPEKFPPAITDALKKYLDSSADRQYSSAPIDGEPEAYRYPEEILREPQDWDDIFPYQYSLNGVPRFQKLPQFRMVAGSVSAELVGVGPSGIAVPGGDSQEPILVGNENGLSTYGAGYPAPFAAQMAMDNIMESVSTYPSVSKPITAQSEAISYQAMAQASLGQQTADEKTALPMPKKPNDGSNEAQILKNYVAPVLKGTMSLFSNR